MEKKNLKNRFLPGNYYHKCYNRSLNTTLVMCYPGNSVRLFTVSDKIYSWNILQWRKKINRRTGKTEKRKSYISYIFSTVVLAKTAINTPKYLIPCPILFHLIGLFLDYKARGTIRSSGLTSCVLQAIKIVFITLVLILRTSAWLKLVFQRRMWYWSEENKRLRIHHFHYY